jgi:thiol-disulfide isomerase/thioredoxin
MKSLRLYFFILLFLPVYIAHSANLVEKDPEYIDLPSISDVNGQEFNFQKLEGNVLVLYFWATWCSGCAKEMESLNAIQKKLKKDRIIVMPISEDFKGEEVVKKFYRSYGLKNLPAFIDKKQTLFHSLDGISLPATFILDSSGEVVASAKGAVNWQEDGVISLLKRYIKQIDMDNHDYTKLLRGQKMFEKTKKEAQNKHIDDLVPISSQTHLDISSVPNKETGEIKVTNSKGEKSLLKIRRPVNRN